MKLPFIIVWRKDIAQPRVKWDNLKRAAEKLIAAIDAKDSNQIACVLFKLKGYTK